ncbi:mannose-P-dolichol utilization defect 1, partial [Brachionus plicatilis]
METFEKLMSMFMSEQCYEEIFFKFNLLNIPCIKMIISKGLGYGILLGSLMLRVPQILIILRAGNAKGISLISEVLGLLAVFGSMAYGYYKSFPIAAYGDTYSLYIQGCIILFMVLFYQNQKIQLFLSIIVISLVTGLQFANMIPGQIIYLLNTLSLFLSVFSKLIQAFENFKNSSTGNLSSITLILQFLGCVARIFTSIQETGDFYMIITYIAVSIANGLLVAQLVYYWNADS